MKYITKNSIKELSVTIYCKFTILQKSKDIVKTENLYFSSVTTVLFRRKEKALRCFDWFTGVMWGQGLCSDICLCPHTGAPVRGRGHGGLQCCGDIWTSSGDKLPEGKTNQGRTGHVKKN